MSLRMSYRGKNINERKVNKDLMNKLLNSNLCIYHLFFINSGKGNYTLYKRNKKKEEEEEEKRLEIWEETSIKLYIEYNGSVHIGLKNGKTYWWDGVRFSDKKKNIKKWGEVLSILDRKKFEWLALIPPSIGKLRLGEKKKKTKKSGEVLMDKKENEWSVVKLRL